MSYRELRNFKEILTVLGYPRLISIENFKTPHFELVADILIWLCQRYDKNMEILDTITTEHDRVAFLKSVAEQLLTKARVKLNLKNLYASNGFAVRELLKVATLLYDAHRNASGDAEEGEGDAAATADVGPGHKFTDVKATRRLASDITKYGIRLYELLGTHVEAKEAAARALGKNYDIDDMGRQLREMEGAVSEQTAQMEQMLGNVQQDEANLQVTDTAAAATATGASPSTASSTTTTTSPPTASALQSKIDKKKTELDRQQKRLQSLQTVRPAFMDEFERLEEELSAHYHYYLQNHRNLAYLESELEKIEFAEQARARAHHYNKHVTPNTYTVSPRTAAMSPHSLPHSHPAPPPVIAGEDGRERPATQDDAAPPPRGGAPHPPRPGEGRRVGHRFAARRGRAAPARRWRRAAGGRARGRPAGRRGRRDAARRRDGGGPERDGRDDDA